MRSLLPTGLRTAANRALLRRPMEPLGYALALAPYRRLRHHFFPEQPEILVNEPWPTDRPLVTVIVPCFNYGRFVPGLLRNLERQTWRDFEIILVEGGSTDGTTAAVVRSFEGSPRVRCIFPDRPHTLGANRLLGLEAARGKYAVFLDADDLLEPTYLEKAVTLLERFGYDHVAPDVRIFREETDLEAPPRPEEIWHTGPIYLTRILQDNCAPVPSMFRLSFWRDRGIGIFTGPNPMEDWDFWMRFATHGARTAHLPEALHWYRMHGKSMTASFSNESWAKEKELVRSRFKDWRADNRRVKQAMDRQNGSVKVTYADINLHRRASEYPAAR